MHWLTSKFYKTLQGKNKPVCTKVVPLSVETLENTGKNAFSAIKRLYLISAKLFELSNQAVFTVEGLLPCGGIHIFCYKLIRLLVSSSCYAACKLYVYILPLSWEQAQVFSLIPLSFLLTRK